MQLYLDLVNNTGYYPSCASGGDTLSDLPATGSPALDHG